jgi:GTP 3',8-cyclase
MHELMLVDTLARPLRNLRLSVTDRCNLRCEYCMPEDEYVWLPREDMLHFEEISTLADLFITLGIDKIRLTGGETLMRRDLPSLVQMLAVKPGLSDLALTTNGVPAGRADRCVARGRVSDGSRSASTPSAPIVSCG